MSLLSHHGGHFPVVVALFLVKRHDESDVFSASLQFSTVRQLPQDELLASKLTFGQTK